jgi:hypothetical protein
VTTAIEGRGGQGANASPEARSGGGGGGGYYGGGGGGVGPSGAVSGGGGGSDHVTPAAIGVSYEDGAGGAGGEDAADPGQPGSVEILYATATTPAVSPHSPSVTPEKSTSTQTTPALHLSVYTHGGQGLINTHALTVKASCGPVACTVHAQTAIHVPGLSGLPILLSSSTPLAADSVGRIAILVPTALRRLLRHYLLRHPRTRIKLKLSVTATAGASREALTETLPMWTLRGFR